jgi:hypothetical protein
MTARKPPGSRLMAPSLSEPISNWPIGSLLPDAWCDRIGIEATRGA